MNHVTFGAALEAIKKRKRVAREGWGAVEFAFIRPAGPSEVGGIMAMNTTMPDSVKTYLEKTFDYDDTVVFTPYLCRIQGSTIINGWLPSHADLFAEDWQILD